MRQCVLSAHCCHCQVLPSSRCRALISGWHCGHLVPGGGLSWWSSHCTFPSLPLICTKLFPMCPVRSHRSGVQAVGSCPTVAAGELYQGQSFYPCSCSSSAVVSKGWRVWGDVPALMSEGPAVPSLLGTAGCGAEPWNCPFFMQGIQYRSTSWHSKTCSVGTVPAAAFSGSSLSLMSFPLSLETCPVWQQADVSKWVEFLQAQIIFCPLLFIYCPRAKPSDLYLNTDTRVQAGT